MHRAGPAAWLCWLSPPQGHIANALSPARVVGQGLGEAPLLVPWGLLEHTSPMGLVLLHPGSGPHCLDTLMCTPPAHEQPGPALPGKATSSPPPLPTPSVSLCVPSSAACLQPSGHRAAGGAHREGGGCQQALVGRDHAVSPAAPVSSGHCASFSRGMATEESISPLHMVQRCQAAWGSLPRDKGHM